MSLNPERERIDDVIDLSPQDDLKREIYGLLGIPVDAVDMKTVLHRIEQATADGTPYLMSTANLNFLVTSLTDSDFRESLLLSDLCTADGMPIVWLGRLLGIPIKKRIAGADIFVALKSRRVSASRLKVFLLGGAEGIAATACKKLNEEVTGVTCVGTYYPGFCSVAEMGTNEIIGMINASRADFLAVALGAKKGQAWLKQYHQRLRIPVRAHLGATINYQAGALKRAPANFQKWGLEWLWRIKEEPKLWKRYWDDGTTLLRLLLTRVIPLIVITRLDRFRSARGRHTLVILQSEDHETVTISLKGPAVAANVPQIIAYFENEPLSKGTVAINLSQTLQIDARFIGFLLVLNKRLQTNGKRLWLTGVPPRIRRYLRINGFEFLLHPVTE